MNDPEGAAATLAIHLIAARRKHRIAAFFHIWPSRGDVEKLADLVLQADNLPIEPHLIYVVRMIVYHFRKLPSSRSLPSKQEAIDWIAQSGGIGALILKIMASNIGTSP